MDLSPFVAIASKFQTWSLSLNHDAVDGDLAPILDVKITTGPFSERGDAVHATEELRDAILAAPGWETRWGQSTTVGSEWRGDDRPLSWTGKIDLRLQKSA